MTAFEKSSPTGSSSARSFFLVPGLGAPRGADSDIDLCILIDHPARKLDVARQIRRSLAEEIQTPLDLLIYDTREFRSRAESLKSIEREISEQGVTLYG